MERNELSEEITEEFKRTSSSFSVHDFEFSVLFTEYSAESIPTAAKQILTIIATHKVNFTRWSVTLDTFIDKYYTLPIDSKAYRHFMISYPLRKIFNLLTHQGNWSSSYKFEYIFPKSSQDSLKIHLITVLSYPANDDYVDIKEIKLKYIDDDLLVILNKKMSKHIETSLQQMKVFEEKIKNLEHQLGIPFPTATCENANGIFSIAAKNEKIKKLNKI